MTASIVIRGLGLITPLGRDVSSTWDALLAGHYIRTHARAAVHSAGTPEEGRGEEGVERPPQKIAFIGLDASASSFILHPSAFDSGPHPNPPNPLPEYQEREPEHSLPRVNRLGACAAAEALSPAARDVMSDDRTGLVVATSKGAADEWIGTPSITRPFGLSAVTDHVAAVTGHGIGPRLTLSGACASGLHALIRAVMLIEHGDADRALVVAAESSMHPLFLQSFRRMGVLAPEGGRCRPFDVHRQGFLVGEAAAAVWLEGTSAPAAGDLVVDRYAFAGDASHLTALNPSAGTLRRLLATAIDGRPVDVIHAHGTGTEANDAAEAAAIQSVLAELPPSAVHSHKGAIGHTLGAAGLVAVVLNAMMHRQGIIPGNAGIETPMPLKHATLSRDKVLRPVTRSVVCAAGFGGATAAISLMTAGRRGG